MFIKELSNLNLTNMHWMSAEDHIFTELFKEIVEKWAL